MTFDDLLENLRMEDEVALIELLNLTSYQLVDILESFIEDQQERLRAYYEDQASVDE